MNDRLPFNPLQAQEVAKAFNAAGVDYLFIGKSAAILLGYPGTTQDVWINCLSLYRHSQCGLPASRIGLSWRTG
jgi:hypothetical protein